MGKATSILYDVHFRRRRMGVTDYAKRLALLKSKKHRLVLRKSNKQVFAQVIEYALDGDKTVASAASADLKEYGFSGKCNTPSAFLTGLLAGKKAVLKGVKTVVLDLGRNTAVKGGVLFAAAAGARLSGLDVPIGEGVSPAKERIEGGHLKEKTGFEQAKWKIEALK
ncbi:50S ribosomal protein L18 [Candidatus Micrarchaeota archaeon]|nr:50S ribosomal protein L18 [Candidatus Micrarchaeota archaeon]